MPNEIFKNKFSIEFVSDLFNLVFQNAIIPHNWCTAIIKPIPKHSSIERIDPLQYRGISLLPNLYKIYSSIVNDRLTNYLEENELYVDEQMSFVRIVHVKSISSH